jgi:hypothetical protein
MKLLVTIKPEFKNLNTENLRYSFWSGIKGDKASESLDSDARVGENFLLREFPSALKNKIIDDIDSQIREIEQTATRYYFELLYRLLDRPGNKPEYLDISKKVLSDEFGKAAEQKQAQLKDNDKYQQLLNKRILASHFVFNVSNFRYASLGFDLILEPTEKFVDFFDNNFEYMQVFFNGYIADIFNDEFNDDNSLIINYSVSIDENFITPKTMMINNKDNKNNKLNKAQWYWSLLNGSLLLPLLISTYLIYDYSNRLNKIEEIKSQRLNMVFEQNNKLIDYYQEEVKRLREFQLKVPSTNNKDSTRHK